MLENATILLIVTLFSLGYCVVITEAFLNINKAITALLLGSVLWFILGLSSEFAFSDTFANLEHHVLQIAEFLLFLWGAMIIVEIMNAHHALNMISSMLSITSKKLRFWCIGIITFFCSSLLDNLTTTIVMVSIVQKLCKDIDERKITGCAVVIAANAGGAWTPIGDVTTTMLWIGGQVSTLALMKNLFIPSIACVGASLLWLSHSIHGREEKCLEIANGVTKKSLFIGILGILALVIVPVLKIFTGIPPYLGMLLSMSVMGMISDLMKPTLDGKKLAFHEIIHRVDTSTILFFLGILVSVAALDRAGILSALAMKLDTMFDHAAAVPFVIGLCSAVIDNVPLVAASISMYPLDIYPKDDRFWHLIAYAAGIGGNLLIIGSAAGVALMGMEKVSFFWYIKRVTLAAFIGYIVGFACYLLI
jgi:Na+/H+ antiporter NhaD/arsenite permease-like protein